MSWTAIMVAFVVALLMNVGVSTDVIAAGDNAQTDPQSTKVIVETVTSNMRTWDHWGFAAKAFAVALGSVIAGSAALISTKKLPDFWHYALSATLAAMAFAWSILQPNEEYKQFRAAYAYVEESYLKYLENPVPENRKALINANAKAREMLKELWVADPTAR